jgi:fructose-1,6-bisphosphatase/inositol monophosphatase family enzyme
MITTTEKDPVIQQMLLAAKAGAAQAIGIRKEAKLNPVLKKDNTWVTDADHGAQATIHAILKNAPVADVQFIGEEAPDDIMETWLKSNKAGKAWVIDPIDGTFAFKRDNGEPWSVSIALQDNGTTTHAVMYEASGDDRDPEHLKGKFYIAIKGQGVKTTGCEGGKFAFEPIKAPQAPNKNVCVGLFNNDNIDGKAHKGASHQAVIDHFTNKDFGINHTYCATIGMLATLDGRMAGYVHGQHFPWDSAAATLIMEEAGCKVAEVPCTDNPKQSIVISSPSQALFSDLGNALKLHNITDKLSGNRIGNRL